jgi:hypothetical protein
MLYGHLETSNNLPRVINYHSATPRGETQFEVHFDYKNPITVNGKRIPSQMLAVMKLPSGSISSNALEVFDYHLTDFPPGRTGPQDMTNANPTSMLVKYDADGKRTRTFLHTGKTYTMNVQETNNGKTSTRKIILSVFICISAGFLILLTRKRRLS